MEGKNFIIATDLLKSPDKIVIRNDSHYDFSPFVAKVYFAENPNNYANLTGTIKGYSEDSLGKFAENYINTLLEPFRTSSWKYKIVNVEFTIPFDCDYSTFVSHNDLYIRVFEKSAETTSSWK